jgi:hypothetical protein
LADVPFLPFQSQPHPKNQIKQNDKPDIQKDVNSRRRKSDIGGKPVNLFQKNDGAPGKNPKNQPNEELFGIYLGILFLNEQPENKKHNHDQSNHLLKHNFNLKSFE